MYVLFLGMLDIHLIIQVFNMYVLLYRYFTCMFLLYRYFTCRFYYTGILHVCFIIQVFYMYVFIIQVFYMYVFIIQVFYIYVLLYRYFTCMFYYTGMLHEGDEILEVNGIDMKGKNINDVSEMLVSISTCFLVGLILRTYVVKVFTQLEPISQLNSLSIGRPSQICNVL